MNSGFQKLAKYEDIFDKSKMVTIDGLPTELCKNPVQYAHFSVYLLNPSATVTS